MERHSQAHRLRYPGELHYRQLNTVWFAIISFLQEPVLGQWNVKAVSGKTTVEFPARAAR